MRTRVFLPPAAALIAVGCLVPGAEVDPSLDGNGGSGAASSQAGSSSDAGKTSGSAGKTSNSAGTNSSSAGDANGGTSPEPDGGEPGTSGSGGSSLAGNPSGGVGNGGMASAGMAGGGVAGSSAGMAGMAGTGGGPSAACTKLCQGAESIVVVCKDVAAVPSSLKMTTTCLERCAKAPAADITCWQTHVTNYKNIGGPHCEHAAGASVCNPWPP